MKPPSGGRWCQQCWNEFPEHAEGSCTPPTPTVIHNTVGVLPRLETSASRAGTQRAPGELSTAANAMIIALAAVMVVGLAYFFVFVMPEPDSGGGTSGTTSSYHESCQDWNRRHPEQYTDPEQCARDAAEMADDLADYLDTHSGG